MNLMQHKHFFTFITTFGVWLVIVLAGISSNYYQTWSFIWLARGSVLLILLLLPLAYWFLLKVWQEHYVHSAWWVAFYTSVPLIIYDYLYLGIMQNRGFGYIFTHWYLTIFYVLVWVELPLVGWYMQNHVKCRF